MTKAHSVIKIDDYDVVVEKISIIKKGDKFIYRTLPEIHIASCDKEDNEGLHKIVGSIGKRLDGVPLVELIIA